MHAAPARAAYGWVLIRCAWVVLVVRYRSGDSPGRLGRPDSAPGKRVAGQVPVRCSGRTGTRFSARPVAARIAETMAGVDDKVGASPTPRRP